MRWLIALLIFTVSATVGHFVTLSRIPSFIMGQVHQALEAQGVTEYVWVQSPRQTPQSQQIVRPSPDIAYAICRFDTKDGPVRISAPTWEAYGTLSVFNARTDNVVAQNLDQDPESKELIIRRKPDPATPDAVIMSGVGIALIRRLAPTQESYDRAADLINESLCEKL